MRNSTLRLLAIGTVLLVSQTTPQTADAQKTAAAGEKFRAETNGSVFDGSVRVRARNDNCDRAIKVRIFEGTNLVSEDELRCGDRMDQFVRKADRVEIEPAIDPYRVEFIKSEIGDTASREFYSTHQSPGCSTTSIVDNRDAAPGSPAVEISTEGVIHTALPRSRENVFTPFANGPTLNPASAIQAAGAINPPYDLHVFFTNAEDVFTD